MKMQTQHPIFSVSEIKVSYHPAVNPLEQVKISCSNDAYGIFDQH